MNKKLLAGVSFAVIAAASFWACGEGNINQMSGEDEVMLRLYALDPATGGPSSELVTLKNDALASCKEDPGCYVQYQAYLNGDEPIEEDPDPIDDPNQGQQQQNQNQNPSSSASRDPFVIVDKPTSSATIIDDPIPGSSSSIEIISSDQFGTCAPAKATHVGIYIGDGRFIHSSFMVRINSLDRSAADFYDRKPLCARRVVGQVDKDGSGIVSVFSNQDYFPQE